MYPSWKNHKKICNTEQKVHTQRQELIIFTTRTTRHGTMRADSCLLARGHCHVTNLHSFFKHYFQKPLKTKYTVFYYYRLVFFSPNWSRLDSEQQGRDSQLYLQRSEKRFLPHCSVTECFQPKSRITTKSNLLETYYYRL